MLRLITEPQYHCNRWRLEINSNKSMYFPRHDAHHLEPRLGDDDVVLDPDAAEAAELLDALAHHEPAKE